MQAFSCRRLIARLLLSIALFSIILTGCERKVFFGNTRTGFKEFPQENTISPDMALDFAKPFLEYSYNLRKQNRGKKYNSNDRPIEYMVLKGRFYYVTRDSFKSDDPKFYIPYAIKVNRYTGKTVKPSPESKYNEWWQKLIEYVFY